MQVSSALSLYKRFELEIINIAAESYAEKFTDPEDPVLFLIAKETYEKHQAAHMLSGHLQGRLLSLLSFLVNPRYILEIGTFTGYSAICLAEGLTPEGELHTIELKSDEAETAKRNIGKSAFAGKIFVHQGNASDIIPSFGFVWDIVFIDADKSGYIDYYKMVLPNVRKGGIVIADNVLFHGQVLEPDITGKNALAIHAFNEYVKKDVSVNKIVLTVRDGLMVIRKK